MDQLSSNEFRKTFARLTVPVLVTVHGHPIGTYTPVRAISGTTPIDEVPPLSMAEAASRSSFGRSYAAPKPGGKK